MTDPLLARLERYYDAVPRRFATVEESGPFTLFLGEPGGWVYYARPRLGVTGPFTPAAVAAALARLRTLGLPPTIEWVHETTPDLLAAVQTEGSLQVEELPLLALDGDLAVPVTPPAEGVRVRLLGPDDAEAVSAATAASAVGFATAGTVRGDAGPVERDAARKPASARVLDLIAAGALRIAVAETEQEGVLATGRTLPIGDVTEVMGVATLPKARRRGLGTAVTAALLADARSLGLQTVFLTASSAPVARIYEQVGFARVGTGWAAEHG